MHVVFVLPRFFPYRGGYENSLFALAKHLSARGHRATVFTTVADDLEAFWLPGFKTFPQEQFTIEGVTVRRFPICYSVARRRASRLLGLLPYWRWKAQHWRPSFRVPGLAKALRAIDADLIHIGPLPYNGLMYAGLHAGERRGIPVVATPCLHTGEGENTEVARHYLGKHQIEMLRRSRKVLCMTEVERERFESLGLPSQRLAIAPHGVDLRAASGGDPEFLRQNYGVDGPAILHLGMKAYEKGSETTVEAMKLLWAKGSNAWLVMAGPSLSTFDSYIAQSARNLPRLLNLPPYGEAEKRNLLAAATIVVQPSRVESLGLVLIEAWANNKPVIAADIDVSRDLVNSSGGGVVVPFGDAGQLANAMERMLKDPNLRETAGSSGYTKALGYDGDACWERTLREFEGAVTSDRPAN